VKRDNDPSHWQVQNAVQGGSCFLMDHKPATGLRRLAENGILPRQTVWGAGRLEEAFDSLDQALADRDPALEPRCTYF
jgi:hypothetical protein